MAKFPGQALSWSALYAPGESERRLIIGQLAFSGRFVAAGAHDATAPVIPEDGKIIVAISPATVILFLGNLMPSPRIISWCVQNRSDLARSQSYEKTPVCRPCPWQNGC
jgi:hypothetical protein